MPRAHPIFARFYALISRAGEERLGFADRRREMLDGIAGRVVEVGCGNGLNFAHYPEAVTEVVAVEPEPTLRRMAMRAAASAPVPVTVVPGQAERIPVEDGSCDAVVASLVLCSVDDPARSLMEAKRVLRPGGELRYFEHIRAADPGSARWQDRLQPVWSMFGGGCHPNRDTPRAIAEAGFRAVRERRFDVDAGRAGALVKPHVIGTAARPT